MVNVSFVIGHMKILSSLTAVSVSNLCVFVMITGMGVYMNYCIIMNVFVFVITTCVSVYVSVNIRLNQQQRRI